MVQRNKLLQLNFSPFTKPSEDFPVYLYENNKIIIYPQTIKEGEIQITYIRSPRDVMWNFTQNSNGGLDYNAAGSIDFELNETEQTNVILRILLYAGVVIKNPDVVQVAATKIQQENINEKS